MSAEPRFTQSELEALHDAHAIGIRCGREHAYTEVWVVVVEGRAFIRSWTLASHGWFRSFEKQPNGSLQLGDREIPVRGVVPRSQRLREAVSGAYADKYPGPESRHWVVGLAEPRRARATLELVPRTPVSGAERALGAKA